VVRPSRLHALALKPSQVQARRLHHKKPPEPSRTPSGAPGPVFGLKRRLSGLPDLARISSECDQFSRFAECVKPLEDEILEMDSLISGLPAVAVRSLERSLRVLTPAQLAFVRQTLERAREEGKLPPRQLSLLEHFFERWHAHELATKMAIIGRITSLFDSGEWSDDAEPQADPAALFPQVG